MSVEFCLCCFLRLIFLAHLLSTYYIHFWKLDIEVSNSFSFVCLVESLFYFFFFWKDYFQWVWKSKWQNFFFFLTPYFETLLHCRLPCIVSIWDSILIFVLLYVIYFIFLTLPTSESFSFITAFGQYVYYVPWYNFLHIYSASWISGFVICSKFGQFFFHYFFKYYFCPPFPLVFQGIPVTHNSTIWSLTAHWYSNFFLPFFFSPLCFILDSFCCYIC